MSTDEKGRQRTEKECQRTKKGMSTDEKRTSTDEKLGRENAKNDLGPGPGTDGLGRTTWDGWPGTEGLGRMARKKDFSAEVSYIAGFFSEFFFRNFLKNELKNRNKIKIKFIKGKIGIYSNRII